MITRGSIAVIRSLSFNPGDLLMLGAPLAWALYTIVGKKVLRTFPPLVATAYASLFGTVLLLPAAALEGSLLSGVHRLTVYGWISVLQLALLGTVVGFVWWYEGVERLGASRAAVFVNLVPLFGVLLSALILSEIAERFPNWREGSSSSSEWPSVRWGNRNMDEVNRPPDLPGHVKPTVAAIFVDFLRLGLTAFGGPAMVGYIRDTLGGKEEVGHRGELSRGRGLVPIPARSDRDADGRVRGASRRRGLGSGRGLRGFGFPRSS